MKFIKSRKGEGFIPTFASVLLSIKQHNPKLKTCTSRIVMENELQTKYCERRNFKKHIKAVSDQLQLLLPTLVYITLLHQIN